MKVAVEILREVGARRAQDLERRYIEEALKFTENNKAETARLLAIDRKTLYRKIDSMEEDEFA